MDQTFDEPARARTFFGQPKALGYLAFTEAWERFSYYGMTSLLVLYMSQALFMPGHVGHIAGFAAFRAGIESLRGPMSTLALASQVYGLYTGFVYFTPLLGGWIADRFIGRRRAVMIGAVMMSAGHLAMAFDASFLLALALLIAGCGLLKGNISTQVGQLYREDDAPGRTRGFSIFSMAINIGAVAGPLTCGLLAQLYGWHVGFGLAGVLMLMGLATYVAGYRHLVEAPRAARRVQAAAPPLGPAQKRAVAALLIAMALTIFQSIAYYQNSNMGLVWINARVDLVVLGFAIPPSWFSALDSFVSIVSVPVLFALWRRQAARGGEPGEVSKIASGAAMASAANLCLAAGSLFFTRVPLVFPLLYGILLGVGFLYYWPTLLALVSRVSPPGLKSTMMGAAFMSLFLSNFTIGQIGGLYEHLAAYWFWSLHAAVAATGACLALMLRGRLERIFADAIA